MDQNRYSSRFYFIYKETGEKLYPVKARRKNHSGRIGFEVFEHGNTNGTLVTDEAELERYVFQLNYGVRMECPDRPKLNGIYKADGRSIQRAE
jgi:hypothetical protein